MSDPLTLSDALRAELRLLVDQLVKEQAEAVRELESREEWGKLGPADRELIIREFNLLATPQPDISSAAKLPRSQ